MRSAFSHGFSLLEMLVYISLLAVVGAIITAFASRLVHSNTEGQIAGEVLDNARSSLHLISQEVRSASAVYTPTSALGTHPGQLSIVTSRNAPDDEKETYVDFYIDDERLYLKREGQAAQLLTSERIRAANFVITDTSTSPEAPAVTMAVTFEPDTPSESLNNRTAVSLSTTVALRGF